MSNQPPPLPRARIREIFLAHGFTIKPGCDDLKPYVYSAARAVLAASTESRAVDAGSEPLTEAMVDRFLSWPLPPDVCADLCTTRTDYPHPRSGTNLLTAHQARAMLEHVLAARSVPAEIVDFCGVMREESKRTTQRGTEYEIARWTCPGCGKKCSTLYIDGEWCHGDSFSIKYIGEKTSHHCGACWLAARPAPAPPAPAPAVAGVVDAGLLQSTDRADVWAAEFAKIVPDVDRDLMIAWFANCAEMAKDGLRRRLAGEADALRADAERFRYLLENCVFDDNGWAIIRFETSRDLATHPKPIEEWIAADIDTARAALKGEQA